MRISTKREKICFILKFWAEEYNGWVEKLTRGFNIKLDQAEEKRSELKGTRFWIMQSEGQKKKRMKKHEESLRNFIKHHKAKQRMYYGRARRRREQKGKKVDLQK